MPKWVWTWLAGAIATGIVATIINDLWVLIKAGALFDFFNSAAGQVRQTHFIRSDLVSTAKQSVAEWILAMSCIVGWLLTFWSREEGESWADIGIFGIGYGFALGLGFLFILSNFERFKDIHLAVGDAQYALAGMVLICNVAMVIAIRLRERRRADHRS
jgi:hypothetical protein